jgi:hypothetical protein
MRPWTGMVLVLLLVAIIVATIVQLLSARAL